MRLGDCVYLRNLSFRLVSTTLMQQKQMQQQGGMLNLYTFSITLLAKMWRKNRLVITKFNNDLN
jgi:hypothetical protein